MKIRTADTDESKVLADYVKLGRKNKYGFSKVCEGNICIKMIKNS